jgi:hypothetical protein
MAVSGQQSAIGYQQSAVSESGTAKGRRSQSLDCVSEGLLRVHKESFACFVASRLNLLNQF